IWRSFEYNNLQIGSTQHLLDDLDVVRVELVSLESAERAFLTTGQNIYLIRYHSSRARLESLFNELESHANVSPEIRESFRRLRLAVQEKLDFADSIVKYTRLGTPEKGEALVSQGVGVGLMDAAMLAIRQLENAQEGYLGQVSHDAEHLVRYLVG